MTERTEGGLVASKRSKGGRVTEVSIAPAQAAEFDVIEALLDRAQLPLEGLRDHPQHMFVARAGNRIVGCASLELYGDAALLRSVAVDDEFRGGGIGCDLTRAALRIAKRRGVAAVYLQTTGAEQFFSRFAFIVIDRADLPPQVRSSWQFTSGCCSSAVVMQKVLTSPT